MRSLGPLVSKIFHNVMTNHIMALAAGLSYYFVMSLFPALILAAAVLGYSPLPHMFGRILGAMSEVVPADSMGLVRTVLRDVITPHRRRVPDHRTSGDALDCIKRLRCLD